MQKETRALLDEAALNACSGALKQAFEQGAEVGKSAGLSDDRICLLLATGIVQSAVAGIREPSQLLRAGLDQLAEAALRRLDADLPRPIGRDGEHYVGRAAAFRALAQQMDGDLCSAPLLSAADNYERYAASIEQLP